MTMKYGNHELELIYKIEPDYWTFYLSIKVDNTETLRSMTYELPRTLKIFSWIIEDIPVRIITVDIPYVRIYWSGVAIGLNVKETVNIQPALDYIKMHIDAK